MAVARSNCSRIEVERSCNHRLKLLHSLSYLVLTSCAGGRKLTFDLLILKVVSESRVTWATSVPILVFLGLSVLDLGPMYTTDRHTSDRRRQTRIIA